MRLKRNQNSLMIFQQVWEVKKIACWVSRLRDGFNLLTNKLYHL